MLSVVEVAKTPPQIFDRLSSYSGNVPFDYFDSAQYKSAQGTSLSLGSGLLLKPNSHYSAAVTIPKGVTSEPVPEVVGIGAIL